MANPSHTGDSHSTPQDRDILSVSELNNQISDFVNDASELSSVCCRGEVTDFSANETALYFKLTDGEAELPCMIWASRYRNMDVELEDGKDVILEGNIDFWIEGGKLDLKPWEVTVVGEGDQAAAVDRLRAELKERGWFADQHRQTPPLFPDRVGVVTSLKGDARYDIENAIHSQDSSVDVLIKHAAVQGPDAPTSLANGIHYFDRTADVDTVIVSRGGGSDTNLQAFNTERVAEAIFTAETPIITAVGHTDDDVIADYVADRAAITPTAAGEYVVESPAEYIANDVDPLEQALEATYRAYEREHEHEQELEQALQQAGEPSGVPAVYYKVAIAFLLLLLLTITALWMGVI